MQFQKQDSLVCLILSRLVFKKNIYLPGWNFITAKTYVDTSASSVKVILMSSSYGTQSHIASSIFSKSLILYSWRKRFKQRLRSFGFKIPWFLTSLIKKEINQDMNKLFWENELVLLKRKSYKYDFGISVKTRLKGFSP